MADARRGTNYSRRMASARVAEEAAAVILAAASQAQRCQDGEHTWATARPTNVTYVHGRQVPPGTRYCWFCTAIAEDETDG